MNQCPDRRCLLEFAFGRASPLRARAIGNHLQSCPVCQKELEEVEALQHLLRLSQRKSPTTTGSECPPDEQLLAFVDGSLTMEERRTLEPHLATCVDCLNQVSEMFDMMSEENNGDASPELAGRKAFVQALVDLPNPIKPSASAPDTVRTTRGFRRLALLSCATVLLLLLALSIVGGVQVSRMNQALLAAKVQSDAQESRLSDLSARFARYQLQSAARDVVLRYVTSQAAQQLGTQRPLWDQAAVYVAQMQIGAGASRSAGQPGNTSAEENASIEVLASALAALADGKQEEAAALAANAADDDSDNPIAWLVLAQVLRDSSDQQGAIKAEDKARALLFP